MAAPRSETLRAPSPTLKATKSPTSRWSTPYPHSGKAGSDSEIRVRGTNSINGYKPLYVVDGLFNDNINFLNPQDIESMEILKDPSSLAIFGVRGANGVIIITTKKAKEGQTRVNINGSFGFKSITDKIALTDAEGFKLLYNEQLRNEGNPEYNFSDWTGNTNWQDEIFRSAWMQSHNVSLTGGSEGVRYNASFLIDKILNLLNT